MPHYPCLYRAPFGNITLIFDEQQQLIALELHGELEYAPYPLPMEWQQKLDDYFAGRLKNFHHPISTQGSAFQQRVWQALCEIPVGETASYTEIAQRIDTPKAVRAVAGACAANKLALAIPCHRVIRQDGSLSGYRWGIERKQALLDLVK